MEDKENMLQPNFEMLRVAGVGLWAYETEEQKLWNTGFADNIHSHDELQCVDISSYLAMVDSADRDGVVN